VAGAGVIVAKHGNRSKSRAGSADDLEALGANPGHRQTRRSRRASATRASPSCSPQQHHTAMKFVAPVRQALGIRTIFNMLGPPARSGGREAAGDGSVRG